MARLIATLIFILALTSDAAAQTLAERIAECALKDSGYLRLQCYDAIAKTVPRDTRERPAATPVATATPAPSPTPAEEVFGFELSSKNPVLVDNESIRPRLVFSCLNGNVSLKVVLDTPLGVSVSTVNTRVDAADVVIEQWQTADRGKTILPPSIDQLLGRMRSAKTLEMKVTGAKELVLRFSFETGDLQSRITALAKICWQ